MKTKMAQLFTFGWLTRKNLDFASRILDIVESMLILVLRSTNRGGWILQSSTGQNIGVYVMEYHPTAFVVIAFGCEKEYWEEFMTYMIIDIKNRLFKTGHKRTILQVNVSEYDVDAQVFLHNCGFTGKQVNDIVVMTFE